MATEKEITIIDENYEGIKKCSDEWYVFNGTLTIYGDVLITINLVTNGNQYIYGNQEVKGDQVVYGEQHIRGTQTIHGTQFIYGNQTVVGEQLVHGFQFIRHNQRVFNNQKVHSNQKVRGHQVIRGNQQIKGSQVVKNYQEVHGTRKVKGTATILGHKTTFSNVLQTGMYDIYFTSSLIKIGCKEFTAKQWESFTDKQINAMDTHSLEWWKKWKKVVLNKHKELVSEYGKVVK